MVALWMVLALPLAAAQCSSDFMSKIGNLDTLKTQAQALTLDFGTAGLIPGLTISTSSVSAVAVDSVPGVDNLGCTANKAFVFKIRLLSGDNIHFHSYGDPGGAWHMRRITRSCTQACLFFSPCKMWHALSHLPYF